MASSWTARILASPLFVHMRRNCSVTCSALLSPEIQEHTHYSGTDADMTLLIVSYKRSMGVRLDPLLIWAKLCTPWLCLSLTMLVIVRDETADRTVSHHRSPTTFLSQSRTPTCSGRKSHSSSTYAKSYDFLISICRPYWLIWADEQIQFTKTSFLTDKPIKN